MSHKGEPAFPFEYTAEGNGPYGEKITHPGMSLRDWFAGKVLLGCLSYSHCNESWGDYHNNSTDDGLASHCYRIADAMLAEREK